MKTETKCTPTEAAIKIRTLLVEFAGLRRQGGSIDPLERHNFPHEDIANIIAQSSAPRLLEERDALLAALNVITDNFEGLAKFTRTSLDGPFLSSVQAARAAIAKVADNGGAT